MKPYPALQDSKPQTLKGALDYIARERLNDIAAWTNLPKVFMQGRKVGKVPASTADVAATDQFGDFNYDASYLYLCVNDGGAAWRRVSLGSF